MRKSGRYAVGANLIKKIKDKIDVIKVKAHRSFVFFSLSVVIDFLNFSNFEYFV
jgi:hypothetical protein